MMSSLVISEGRLEPRIIFEEYLICHTGEIKERICTNLDVEIVGKIGNCWIYIYIYNYMKKYVKSGLQ